MLPSAPPAVLNRARGCATNPDTASSASDRRTRASAPCRRSLSRRYVDARRAHASLRNVRRRLGGMSIEAQHGEAAVAPAALDARLQLQRRQPTTIRRSPAQRLERVVQRVAEAAAIVAGSNSWPRRRCEVPYGPCARQAQQFTDLDAVSTLVGQAPGHHTPCEVTPVHPARLKIERSVAYMSRHVARGSGSRSVTSKRLPVSVRNSALKESRPRYAPSPAAPGPATRGFRGARSTRYALTAGQANVAVAAGAACDLNGA